MAEQEREDNKNLQPQSSGEHPGDRLDAAGKSLSEALRISFIILKVIMIVLVIVFLASGFRTVGPDEQALVLRFGKIRGLREEERILKPGPHWVFPYPIDEIVKIPVKKNVNLPINSFWYYQRPGEMLAKGPTARTRIKPTLDPILDGYCITRSEKQNQTIAGSADSDYNIVHSKWQLTYKIDEPELFFKNVYTDDVKPGESYAEVIEQSVTPLLECLVEDSIVTAMVNYTIDEAISSLARIPDHVAKLVQQKLDKIESGIKVVSVQLTHSPWPRQVDRAFWDSIRASQMSQRVISEARTYAEKTLNEAAGPVAQELLAALEDETVGEEEKELLWSQLAGAAQEEIAEARAYRTEVVENAKANAEYLQKILSEYRKYPKLVLQEIYLDAMEYVLNNVVEKFIIQRAEGTKGAEIRVLINRDPMIKPKSGR
jgi:membrane protease subunit HflK